MQKLQKSIFIEAPKEKVWEVMLGDSTYREWTAAFHPGSYYKGNWEEGSKMVFVGPDENGGEMGMVSRIKENRPHEYISIEHLGIIKNGIEDTTSEEAKKWAPAYENYTFTKKDGGTGVVVDMDIEESEKEMFEDMWLRALQKLKEITERAV